MVLDGNTIGMWRGLFFDKCELNSFNFVSVFGNGFLDGRRGQISLGGRFARTDDVLVPVSVFTVERAGLIALIWLG